MLWESAATNLSCCILFQVGLSGKKVPWTTWAAAAVALTGRGSFPQPFGISLTLCHSLLYPNAWARSKGGWEYLNTPGALLGIIYGMAESEQCQCLGLCGLHASKDDAVSCRKCHHARHHVY